MEKACNSHRQPFLLLHLLPLFLSPLPALANPAASPSQIISRFQQYLQINTTQPSPDYQTSTQFILSQASSLSLESRVIEFVKNKPVVLLKWPGSDPSLPSVLLNSHTDVVSFEHSKWIHPPLGGYVDRRGDIFGRGSQDMKCVGMQYLEAIRRLKASGFRPKRSLYLSFVPDEEIGGNDGAKKLAYSDVFKDMNVEIVLDEGPHSTLS
ncbi:aquaporin interactor [Hibiscus trionum]|uniref:Aquaporin interactor n=1 Tax=Hibiscus trionum TaxID=183268 RepID=A0A9W7HYS1_HIBTR|nr:aquaporin interactor [Hibiscus trionum]